MSSRRAQIRQIFQSVPSSELTGTTLDALYSRCESNLAALDVWSNQGNQLAMRKAGTGIIALCAWLAAKKLTDNASPNAFQKLSGLSPAQFQTSEKDLSPGIQIIQNNPSMNRREVHDNASHTTAEGSQSGADMLAKWAQDMKSGISPLKKNKGSLPSTPRSSRIIDTNSTSSPITPSRSGLRDRSSIKEKRVFDPSPQTTPSKTKRPSTISTPSSSARTLQKRRVSRLEGDETHTPQKSVRTDSNINSNGISVGRQLVPSNYHSRPKAYKDTYPISLGFTLGGDDEVKWSQKKALERIKKCIDSIDKMKSENRFETWTTDVPGRMENINIQL